jgi:hypothetical protein
MINHVKTKIHLGPVPQMAERYSQCDWSGFETYLATVFSYEGTLGPHGCQGFGPLSHAIHDSRTAG